MKTSDKSNKVDPGKQKKQLIALGGLSAVFAAVLAIQFGGSSSAPAASAMTAAPATDPAAPAADAPVADAAPAATPIPVAKDNPVLAATTPEPALKRSPFSNFWNVAPTGTTTGAPITAPTVVLNGTMSGNTAGLAVIDGQMHFVGDTIGGWALAEVRPRSITLRAPTGEQVVVNMPLPMGNLEIPPAIAAAATSPGIANMPRDGAPAPSDG